MMVTFIAGRANHWNGPQSSALPVGLPPEHHQRGTLSHSHITQVNHHYSSIDFLWQLTWSLHIWTSHQGKQINQIVHKINMCRKYCDYNGSELHFSWKVLFPVWQLILAAANILAAIKRLWSMGAYWLTGTFFFSLPWKEKLSISMLESFHNPRLPGAKLVSSVHTVLSEKEKKSKLVYFFLWNLKGQVDL